MTYPAEVQMNSKKVCENEAEPTAKNGFCNRIRFYKKYLSKIFEESILLSTQKKTFSLTSNAQNKSAWKWIKELFETTKRLGDVISPTGEKYFNFDGSRLEHKIEERETCSVYWEELNKDASNI